MVLRGYGCRAELTPGPWLRQSPLQLLHGHRSIPHGGVMGRTWAFLPLGLEEQQGVQQQLQATSSSSSATVAGGSGEGGRRHEKLRGEKRKNTHLLPEKPLRRLEWGGPLPKGLASWSEVPGGLMRGVDVPLPATRAQPPPCSTSSASHSSAPFILGLRVLGCLWFLRLPTPALEQHVKGLGEISWFPTRDTCFSSAWGHPGRATGTEENLRVPTDL